nr:MAG TPA: nucleoside triphosphate pyrophosphohydrolase [Caudoviricetes sp.]
MIEGLARQILQHYGVIHQKSKTIEELAELIVALQKDVLEGKESHSRAVLEEIADVHIMLTQLLDDESDKTAVSLIVDKKLKRQIRRIKAEKDKDIAKGWICKHCRWYEEQYGHTGICLCSRSSECGNYIGGNLMTCQEWEMR